MVLNGGTMPEDFIKVESLHKHFKLNKKQMALANTKDQYKKAVNGISFTVNKGEIFALLGPNGAGKTTSLRSIASLIKPTSGTITIGGTDVVKNPEQAREKLTFLTNELKLDGHFSPNYTIEFFGKMRGMTKEQIANKKSELFAYFGIDKFANTKIKDLSTGMKQKISIAVSLVHDPHLIIFDEPTNGLDIITARSVINYLFKAKENGKTIIVSTHQMHVAEKLADRLAIIMQGKISAYGELQQVITECECSNLEETFFKLYDKSEGNNDV